MVPIGKVKRLAVYKFHVPGLDSTSIRTLLKEFRAKLGQRETYTFFRSLQFLNFPKRFNILQNKLESEFVSVVSGL